ncbi:MAG TPA: hypothetical protein VII40_12135 [Xanthobacteraceae bacterium]
MITKSSSDEKLGRQVMRAMAHVRQLGIGALLVGITIAHAQAPRGATAITCTNPASGATWQIRVDYDRGTVDANPATVGDATIKWHDANDGGNYTLDRKSGNLTVVVASSTGGYTLYDHCKLDK